MIVKFIDVGRENKSWEATTNEVTYEWLYGQVKKKGTLATSDSNLELALMHENDLRELAGLEVEHG